MTEKDVLGCALAAQKHSSHLYHAASEHVDDPRVLRELFTLMQEEQELRLEIYRAMHQRGWYNPQPVDAQQLQQAKSQFSSTLNRLQQQSGFGQSNVHSSTWQSQSHQQQPTHQQQYQQQPSNQHSQQQSWQSHSQSQWQPQESHSPWSMQQTQR